MWKVQNAFQLHLPNSTNLRVNCPVLYIMMMVMTINENKCNIIKLILYLQKKKRKNLKFLPDILCPFEMKFCSPIY